MQIRNLITGAALVLCSLPAWAAVHEVRDGQSIQEAVNGAQPGDTILVYPGEGTLLQRHAEEFMGSRSLPDPLVIVRDQEMKMVTEWGLRWDRPRETAYPSAYIIDRNGRVRWLKVSDNHAGRASVDEIVRELRKL